MPTLDNATLSKLSDSGHTVASPEEDIRGRKVTDKDGADIGKVADLLIDDHEQKVRFLLVEDGGYLGIGETKSFIPVDAITRVTAEEVHVDQSRDHVAGAPRYDPDLAVDDRTYYGSVYGYAPFWEPVYIYPGYPHYPRR